MRKPGGNVCVLLNHLYFGTLNTTKVDQLYQAASHKQKINK